MKTDVGFLQIFQAPHALTCWAAWMRWIALAATLGAPYLVSAASKADKSVRKVNSAEICCGAFTFHSTTPTRFKLETEAEHRNNSGEVPQKVETPCVEFFFET